MEAEDQLTITIGLFGNMATAYTEFFNSNGFKAAFPDVVIQIQSLSFGDHHDRLVTQIESGVGLMILRH